MDCRHCGKEITERKGVWQHDDGEVLCLVWLNGGPGRRYDTVAEPR